MYINSKTVLIVVCTFIMGLVVGVLVNGTIMRYHFEKRLNRMRTPEGFIQRMEKVIQPDQAQRVVMRRVLLKHFYAMFQFRQEWPALMDSLQHDLATVLTEKQMARLKKSALLPPERHFKTPIDRRPARGRGRAPAFPEPKK